MKTSQSSETETGSLTPIENQFIGSGEQMTS